MTPPSSQSILAGIALVILGVLGGCLIFNVVPPQNATLLGMIVGALAGALTVGGAPHLAAALKTPPAPLPSSDPATPPQA